MESVKLENRVSYVLCHYYTKKVIIDRENQLRVPTFFCPAAIKAQQLIFCFFSTKTKLLRRIRHFIDKMTLKLI